MKPWHILLIIGIIVLLAGGGVVVVKAVKARGSVVSPRWPLDDKTGIVTVPPSTLLAETNAELVKRGLQPITLDELAFASSLASEHGNDGEEVLRWTAWAIRNATGNQSMFTKLTKSSAPASSGKFARQRADGRYAASQAPPTTLTVAIAREVLRAPASADPTRKATNFFSPKAQDALRKRALAGDPTAQKVKQNAAELRASWLAKGLVSRGSPPGAPANLVEFFHDPKVRIA